jgi:hypothetical protein
VPYQPSTFDKAARIVSQRRPANVFTASVTAICTACVHLGVGRTDLVD